MQICIYEDEKYINFQPLSYSRPVYDLLCGAATLKEKIQRAFPDFQLVLHCRRYLQESVERANPDINVNKISDEQLILINGRIIASTKLRDILDTKSTDDKIYLSNNQVVAAKLSGENISKINVENGEPINFQKIDDIESEEVAVTIAEYIWDLIYQNSEQLSIDIDYLSSNIKKKRKTFDDCYLVKPESVFIQNDVIIKPGAVLDASKGPIYIDEKSVISSNAVIEGPVYIGKSSIIKNFASINNASIGDVCKVGGEVEDSIILSYTNKQHPGFLGHSYLGSWINIGADTNCSDLKNNYSTVKILMNGKQIDTGKQFLGLIMGDHSKTAINTMFNTGTIVGFSCNVFGPGFPRGFINSFSWGGSSGFVQYDLSKAIDTARTVFKRRNVSFDKIQEEQFANIYKITSKM